MKAKIVKRNILTSFVLLFFSTCCIAQTNIGNMLKYWNYKKILHDKFVIVGPGCGMSLIANQRKDSENLLWWRDATIELGWYISVLATEYGLLKRDGQNTDETVEELFYAIEAFNRLDRTAEAYWRHYHRTDAADVDEEDLWCNVTVGTGDLNGFFIRDDISEEFLRTNNDHFQIDDINALITSCTIDSGQAINNSNKECASSFITGIHQGVGPWEVSQDQITYLFMGFALVVKYVDRHAEFQGTFLKQEVINIVNRIISYLQSNQWSVVNPVTNICVHGIAWHRDKSNFNLCSDGGAISLPLSYGFAYAACAMNNDFDVISTDVMVNDVSASFIQCAGLIDPRAENEGKDIWLTIKNIGGISNMLVNTLAAIGNSWDDKTQELIYKQCEHNNDSTWGLDTSHMHLPLLHRLLYGNFKDNSGNNIIPERMFKYLFHLIDLAPCDGVKTCKDCPKESGGYEWSTNIFRSRIDRGKYETGTSFPGYDYMLLYNLLRLTKPGNFLGLPYSKNLHVTGAFPFTGSNNSSVGSKSLPLPFIGYDTLTANCQILEDGDITFQAGKEIVLQDGFEVKEGANFEAFIEPFECGGGAGKRSANQNPIDYTSWRTRINVEQIVNEETAEQTEPEITIGPNLDNFPNPFNQFTNFTYTINENSLVTLIIRNLYGNKVVFPIYNKPHFSGCYKLTYDASDLSSGIYYYTLQAGNYVETKKMVIVK